MSQNSHHDLASGNGDQDPTTRAVPLRSRPRLSSSRRSTPSKEKALLPAVGEEMFGFHLLQELGHGAFARVFLASQADLASRPVVVKISKIEGDEPQTLAQLQHTHIVPIHSVHEDPDRGLRVVCMPFFGGASLNTVLQTLWTETPQPETGEQMAQALSKVGARPVTSPLAAGQAAPPRPRTNEPPPLVQWARLNHFGATAWLVSRLADGLQHAHQRGILHRDIKPSNILLSGDGEPMLLDFNVSHNQHGDQPGAPPTLGGTVAYMAPEHLRALATRDPELARQVGRCADIYSLGMVLYELLAGGSPFDQRGTYSPVMPLVMAMVFERSRATPSARQKRTDIPWSLESIVRKCLAPEPTQRYQEAEHLSEDLQRFLDNRPLKYAPELSKVERVRKWMRRHPRLTSSGTVATVAAVLLGVASVSLVGVRQHLQNTQAQLQVVQAHERKRQFEAGHERALCLVNTTTDLPEHLRAASQDHLAQGLQICEQTLALYQILDGPDWQQDAGWSRLSETEQRDLAEDARELLLLLAWARVRTTPSDAETLQGALTLLERAEAIPQLAPSRALWEYRAYYLDQLGDATAARAAQEQAQQIQPASARDHYLLATTYSRQARYAEAIAELDRALQRNPRHYWSWTQRGLCQAELGRHALAATDFSVCIGLWPEFAWGYFNRGYALERSGNRAEAVKDYTAALERDPSFLLAYLNRGMARLELKDHDGALADFAKVAGHGHVDAALHLGTGVALEGLKRPAEADAAFAQAFAILAREPEAVRTRITWVYGFAVAGRRPKKALEAFDDVLARQPNHPEALYGRAMVLSEQGRDEEAIPLFNRALEASPGFIEARRFRGVLLARHGRFEDAGKDINWCLEKEPEAGATLYAAACVAARVVEATTDDATAQSFADQSLAFLQRAFARGYGQDKAASDPDLKGLQRNPKFVQLVRGESSERNRQ